MHSLYGRLFKYRESPKRTPLEDFLTEMLADFINRLPPTVRSTFIGEMFIRPNASQQWELLQNLQTELTAETQYQTEAGRLDLVILSNGSPIVVVENKISAPFSKRNDDNNQLQAYGRWLNSKYDGSRIASLCLLTHLTSPPDDFLEEGVYGSYGVSTALCRWSAIGRKLKSLAQSDFSDDSATLHVKFLAEEFHSFLMEQGMTGEYAGLDEFSAAFLYLKAADKMEHTFKTISDHLDSLSGVFPRLNYSNDATLWYESADGLIWGWRYLADTLYEVYFGYGISRAPKQHFLGSSIPSEDSIFLCIATSKKREVEVLKAAASREPIPGWIFASLDGSGALISFKPLSDALLKPEEFAPKMIVWINQNHSEIERFVRDLKA